MAIGIFDSGLGGLSVLKYVLKMYPNKKMVYFADTEHFPYGTKNKEELIKYADKIVDFFISEGVTEILIACNTATALTLDYLDKKYKLEIHGIITPVCDYILKKDIKNITLIATSATIKSKVYNDILKDRIINNIEAPLLVQCAENMEEDKAKVVIQNYFKDIMPINIILGCTHFPLLIPEFKEVFPKANLIDPALELVKKIKLTHEDGNIVLYCSKDLEKFKRKVYKILKREDLDVRLHKWEIDC